MKKKCLHCDRDVRASNLCILHYKKKKWREKYNLDPDLTKKIKRSNFPEICSECKEKSFSKGLCKKCYMFKWHASKVKAKNIVERKPKGSGCLRKDGYRVLVKNGKRTLEHTWIMSMHLGRSLIKGESIHHKNGIRDDNRIENLELWSTSHPSGQRVQDKIEWCNEFLKFYQPI